MSREYGPMGSYYDEKPQTHETEILRGGEQDIVRLGERMERLLRMPESAGPLDVPDMKKYLEFLQKSVEHNREQGNHTVADNYEETLGKLRSLYENLAGQMRVAHDTSKMSKSRLMRFFRGN